MKKYLILSLLLLIAGFSLYKYEYRAEIRDFSLYTLEDHAVSLPSLFSEYSDRIKILSHPTKGVLKNGKNGLSFIPSLNFHGKDSFTFQLSRGIFASDKGVVKISVHPVNDPPVLKLSSKTIYLLSGSSKKLPIKATDPDDKVLRFYLVNSLKFGEITGSWPHLRYKASKTITEPSLEIIQFEIADRFGVSRRGVLEVKITPDPQWTHLITAAEAKKKKYDCLNQITPLIRNGGISVGDLYTYETTPGAFYVPASTIKILTAAVVLNTLGENFRFKTKLFKDAEERVYIKGEGDPSLKVKDYQVMIDKIIKQSKKGDGIKEIVIDSSAFSGRLNYNGRKHSFNYFEAPLSALSINQNTVNVVKRFGRIYMRDRRLPLSSYLKNRVKRMPDGRQFIPVANSSKGVDQFLVKMLQKELNRRKLKHITVKEGRTPTELTPFYIFESEKRLSDILEYMLKFSNNFMANQLLLVASYEKLNRSVSLDDGELLLSTLLKHQLDIETSEFLIKEGAGLSPKTHLTLNMIKKVLEYYYPMIDHLPWLVESKYPDLASVYNSRKIKAKTGSLRDVYNLVGYIDIKGGWLPFAIFLNQKENGRAKVMEKIVECVSE